MRKSLPRGATSLASIFATDSRPKVVTSVWASTWFAQGTAQDAIKVAFTSPSARSGGSAEYLRCLRDDQHGSSGPCACRSQPVADRALGLDHRYRALA